ncbi:MAG: CAP domain-containing protein [candidate division WWE3 bacterium]|nr:CAP domain-containing protein [candidate division WWE3 bacterium]
MSLGSHFLPKPHPSKYGHHRRANLLGLPALASYALFLVGLVFSVSLIGRIIPNVLGFATSINITDLLTDTNGERLKNNLSTLVINDALSKAAAAKGAYMFAHNFWAHVAPDGTTPWYFISNSGYDYQYAGENLARDFNDSQAVVTAWMNSPSHRENMLNSHYTDIGFAVVDGKLDGEDTTLVVQMFGKLRTANYLSQALPEAAATKVDVTPINSSLNSSRPVPSAVPLVSVTSNNPQILPAFAVQNASKSIAIVLGAFLTLLFAIDGIYVWRRGLLRISGSTLAHLGLLILAIIGIWFTSAGAIT